MKVAIVILSAILALASSQDILLESPRVTNWGHWGALEMCTPNSYVYGMRIKVNPYQGTFGDDSALNAIELLCISDSKRTQQPTKTKSFNVIKSREGFAGGYGDILECPEPGFATGFQLRSEKDQGWYADDSAANSLKLFCSTGEVIDGNGMAYGDWTAERRCPRGLRLCGIRTQVEDDNSDYSGLNNVDMACCSTSKLGVPLPLDGHLIGGAIKH